MQFLETHYDEKNATDLYSKLTFLPQLPEETSYSFVMRCIDLRQKVLFASLKSDVKYDKALMLRLIFKTEKDTTSIFILPGIEDLPRKCVSDEDLIEAVTRGSASEKERIATQGKAKCEASTLYEVAVFEDSTVSMRLKI